MADIAAAPQSTKVSASVNDASVVSPQNDMNDAAVPAMASTESSAMSESPDSEHPESELQEKVPPKPAFVWGKPATTAVTTISTNYDAATTKPKKSLMDIMQEEQEMSKAEQAQKEEEDFMKQAIQQSLAMQQQEEDDLALALRLSQLDAGVDMTGFEEDFPVVSDESANLNLKQAPVPEAVTQTAAAASLPDTVPSTVAAAASASASLPSDTGLSEEELASIQLAIQQAEDEELQKSLQLAMQLEMENEAVRGSRGKLQLQQQGNVRLISREEYLMEQQGPLLKKDHGEDDDYHHASAGGFRINAQHQSAWTRLDGFVVGPNDEIRTKHDPELQGQANAHRLHLDDEYEQYENGKGMRVGNKAYNSFQQTMKKKTVKGVASHGQGRANTDTEKTKEGALDSNVRLLIGKTINQDWIDEFHGCVKEGKEALVYHATSGVTSDVEMGVGEMDATGQTTVGDLENNQKYDVAVKVFKRMQEFRNRGQYVQGDPRYHSQEFSHSSGRVQLELWAEKEYRNLVRAYRVGIPVPQPLLQRENVLFLRFLGQDGWPCPQLREVKLKKGGQKWTALYEQTMEAIQTLYNDARLVHGDLSEYNLLVCPSQLLLRKKEEQPAMEELKNDNVEEEEKKDFVKIVDDEDELDQKMPAVTFGKDKEYDPNALQIALIDFGQAVDTRHPEATELLERDVLRVKQFFDKMGITTLSTEAAMTYVTTKGAPLAI